MKIKPVSIRENVEPQVGQSKMVTLPQAGQVRVCGGARIDDRHRTLADD